MLVSQHKIVFLRGQYNVFAQGLLYLVINRWHYMNIQNWFTEKIPQHNHLISSHLITL